MIYLLERQVGFGDNEGIGFPSIKGCLAVAYQTTSGIFGFHNAGNSAAEKFVERSKKWRDWVFTHPNGKDAGVALYGVSFIRRNLRGYLASIFTEPREVSALVEFRKEGRGYGIFVREWYDDAKDGVKKEAWSASTNFTHLDSKPPYMPKEMVTDVDQSGMIRAYPERLGGL